MCCRKRLLSAGSSRIRCSLAACESALVEELAEDVDWFSAATWAAGGVAVFDPEDPVAEDFEGELAAEDEATDAGGVR